MQSSSYLTPLVHGVKSLPPRNPSLDWVAVKDQRRDPDDPIHTDNQQTMLQALTGGHFSLAMEIYRIARTQYLQRDSHISWSWLCEDLDKKEFNVYLQLISLPTNVLRSLIRNTLPHDYQRDPQLRSAVDRHLKVTSYPGVYCQAIAVTPRYTASNVLKEDSGKSWSKDQVEKICEDITLYMENSPEGNAWGLTVDQAIPSGIRKYQEPADDPWNRRYCLNSNRDEQRTTLKQWMECLRSQQSWDDTTRPDDAQHSIRSRMEVGWSIDQEQRLVQHGNNGQTTHVWGIGQALARLNWRDQYAAPYQWSLFRVWDCDVRFGQLTEHLGSVLCSAYTWEGGFNSTHAGNVSFKDGGESSPSAPTWAFNGKEVFVNRSCTKRNFEKDLRDLTRVVEELRKMPAREAKRIKVEKAREEEDKALEQYWKYRKENEKLEAQLAAVKVQVARSQMPVRAPPERSKALIRAREHLAKLKKARQSRPSTPSPAMPSEYSLSPVLETPFRKPARLALGSPVTPDGASQNEGDSFISDDANGTDITSPFSIPSSSPFIPGSS
ncbi:MAG: hypothetical protein M1830_008072 [Pleopsidium flavum]|nr:MAG: hypothetical protein M1830_008072 [Pleopsidium flavum]